MSVLIYKLYNSSDCYIGSTKHSLQKRLSQHKSPHNRCCSKLIIEQGDYKMGVSLNLYNNRLSCIIYK